MNIEPRIGIIGCGMIGETHAQSLRELGVPVSQFADKNLSRAEALANEFGGKVASSAESLILSDEIDAVYICTYHDTHAPLAILASQHGKHIFLEKPMGLTESDCRRIAQAVDQSGVICMTGFKLRYYPLVQKAIELIPNPTILAAQVFDTRWPDEHWANDPIKGGGNVLSQGCHAVDLVCELARSRAQRVYAEGGNFHHPGIGITDTLLMTLTFENGCAATISIADAGGSPVVGKFSFQAMDGSHSVHLYDRLKKLAYIDDDTYTALSEDEEYGFLEESREFLSALREGRRPGSDHHAGLRATLILLRAIESARTHQSISLDHLPQ